jgi:glycosyltransferase involved in cell wall biosynthesis
MAKNLRPAVGFPHPPPPEGGPGTFQSYFEDILRENGFKVVYPGDGVVPRVVCVVGGTAKIPWLLRCKARGARILHRLDGVNWRHRLVRGPLRGRLLADLRNRLMVFVRNRLADHVVYQSEFVKEWWHREYRPARCDESVIHNGADLERFRPANQNAPAGPPVLLCVEGNVQPDEATLKILEDVCGNLLKGGELAAARICGGVSPQAKARLEGISGLRLMGVVPREKMPGVYTEASIFLNLEINPPCPNAVIEAMASGLPVVGFDTGSLAELVPEGAGMTVPYGGDPWRLEGGDTGALKEAVRRVIGRRDEYGREARLVAEKKFGLEKMAENYLEIVNRLL